MLLNKTYWFKDIKSGEEFFVEANTPREARLTAVEIFDAVQFFGEVSYFFAENMGYDTY